MSSRTRSSRLWRRSCTTRTGTAGAKNLFVRSPERFRGVESKFMEVPVLYSILRRSVLFGERAGREEFATTRKECRVIAIRRRKRFLSQTDSLCSSSRSLSLPAGGPSLPGDGGGSSPGLG